MDYLWTPWRYQYITPRRRNPACACFAPPANPPTTAQTLVVHRGAHNFVILNRYPVHQRATSWWCPSRTWPRSKTCPSEALAEMMRLARDAERHLRAVYRPDGLNLGMNLGKSAGAGIAGHLHMHVLPRWTGDTNFMTVVAETRVLPEDLETTWEKLREAFSRNA